MKQLLIVLVALLIRINADGQVPCADTIGSDEITVDSYNIGSYKSRLLPLFNKADSVSHYNEMGNCSTTALHFKKSVISICDSVFDGFDALDNSLTILIKKKHIKIGDNDKIVKYMFPKSFQSRSKDDPDRTYITIYLNDYEGLSFIINNKEIITEIMWWVDNS